MTQEEKWNIMYLLLLEYYKEKGNVEVPISFITDDGEKLGIWVSTQRTRFRINKLSTERKEKLRLLGFRFEKIDFDAVWAARWEYMYNLLINYKKRYGDTDVSSEYKTISGDNLGTWVRTQRAMYRNNRLDPNKEEKLRLLGFRFYNSENDEEIEESKPLTRIRKR